MSEIVMSQDQYRETFPAQYREACADDPDNVRGKPFTLPAGDANHSDVITGVSSPSTFAEAFAAAPASCPGCERARSVAVGLQGEVERLTATLSRVEALAERWRYKGEFGWGPWQEGYGPDQEGLVLDAAATDLLSALAGEEASASERVRTGWTPEHEAKVAE